MRRLRAIMDRMGAETFAFYIDELIAYAERRTRAEVAKLPHGVYTADGYVDTDGFTDEPVHLVAKMVVDEDGMFFDSDRLRPAATGAGELHLRPDLLRLCVCPQVFN